MRLATAPITLTLLLAVCTHAASAEGDDLTAEEARTAAEFNAAVEAKNSELAYSLAERRAEIRRKLVQQASESARPDAQESLSTTLAWLADERDARSQYEAAAKLRGEIVELSVQASGAEHWRTAGARLAQDRSLKLAKFTPEQHTSLARASALVQDALALREQKKYEDAIRSAESAAEIRRDLFGGEHPEYATSLSSMAGMYYSLGQYAKSLSLFEQSLDISRKTLGAQHPQYAGSLVSTGSRFLVLGNVDVAERCYRPAFDAIQSDHPARLKMLQTIAVGMNRVAGQRLGESDYAAAESAFALVRDCAAASSGTKSLNYAQSLANLGEVYRQLGEYSKAEPLLINARDVARELKGEEDPDYAAHINKLGLIYERMGEYAKAEPLLVKALEIRERKLGEKDRSFGESLNNVALLYHRMSQFDRAEQYYRRARDISASVSGENTVDFANATANLALLCLDTGRYDESRGLYEQALKIRSAAGEQSVSVADTLDQLAKLNRLQGKLAEALELHTRAREIYRTTLGTEHAAYAWALHRLGTTRLLMHQPEEARSVWKEALEVKLKIASQTLPWLPEAQALSFLTTLTTDDSSGGRDPLLSAWRSLPERNDDDQLAIYDAVWDTRSLVFQLLTARREQLSDSPQAQETLRELTAVRQHLAQLALAPPAANDEQKQARQNRLAALNESKEALERSLATLSQQFRRDRERKSSRPADLMALLPTGVAVVDFVRVNVWTPNDEAHRPDKQPTYEAFVLQPADNEAGYSVAWVSLGPAEEIDAAIENWRLQIQRYQTYARGRRLGRPMPKADDSVPVRLRSLIWEPIESHLQSSHTVVLIPDGALHRLPWSALPGRTEGSFLLETYQFVTASSGRQVVGLLSEPPPHGNKSLLVGGVDYDSESKSPAEESRTRADSWDFLPGTLEEVNVLQSLTETDEPASVLTGKSATETAVRHEMPASRYIHLATHGFFADEKFRSAYGIDPADDQLFGGQADLVTAGSAHAFARNPLLLTGVLLSGANLAQASGEDGLPLAGELDDGRLTAEEVVNLDLKNTELAVLSACETGLGNVGGGEGVFGLQRAFHLAGVRTTLASLWQVDDKATRVLMTEFYENLWKRKLSRAEALRRAQLTVLKRFDPESGKLSEANLAAPSNPYYWAAFSISGDWR